MGEDMGEDPRERAGEQPAGNAGAPLAGSAREDPGERAGEQPAGNAGDNPAGNAGEQPLDGAAVSPTPVPPSPVSPAGREFEAHLAFVEGLVKTVQMLDAHESRIHALRAFAISELHEHFRREARDALEAADAPTLTAAEVAAALNVSQRLGRAMVEEAVTLASPGFVPVMDALREGRVDKRRAKIMMEHACILPPGKDSAFSEAAVELACPEDPDRAPSPGALSRRLRRLAEKYHDEPLAARKERAAGFRRVDVEPGQDGMCWITAHVPGEVGAAIDARLEAIGRSLQVSGESRGIAQLRADVFRDLLLGGGLAAEGTDPDDGGSAVRGAALGGVRMEVVVTVPARTLTGQSETPAEILGYGPLDAPTVRLLAAEAATWTTMFVNPGTGAPLALGRRRYTPSLAIRRFLGARDRTCRFPGCDKPAPATEADHTAEWQDGGATDVANLALLCREHHRLKSLGHWKLKQLNPDCGGTAQQMRAEAESGTRAEAARRRGEAESGAGAEAARRRGEAESGTRAEAARSRGEAESGAGAEAQDRGGVLEWTSPAGRRYLTYPETDVPPPF
ncbi:DUF222 domain-containing protein [Sinomonas sp. JGH33]|uniref:DUF222 domain-containing protein n=1 Tax=Sinomonas terricola TaxID=3110330 RepID=A0ABU5T7Z0_9MICC|nr:DUF222 domain-containing protein [Sinomonas sp. JGH33]MEA5455809.1 DUF222 domain-containing protein [Sinomonas sp. JGH33]